MQKPVSYYLIENCNSIQMYEKTELKLTSKLQFSIGVSGYDTISSVTLCVTIHFSQKKTDIKIVTKS